MTDLGKKSKFMTLTWGKRLICSWVVCNIIMITPFTFVRQFHFARLNTANGNIDLQVLQISLRCEVSTAFIFGNCNRVDCWNKLTRLHSTCTQLCTNNVQLQTSKNMQSVLCICLIKEEQNINGVLVLHFKFQNGY